MISFNLFFEIPKGNPCPEDNLPQNHTGDLKYCPHIVFRFNEVQHMSTNRFSDFDFLFALEPIRLQALDAYIVFRGPLQVVAQVGDIHAIPDRFKNKSILEPFFFIANHKHKRRVAPITFRAEHNQF